MTDYTDMQAPENIEGVPHPAVGGTEGKRKHQVFLVGTNGPMLGGEPRVRSDAGIPGREISGHGKWRNYPAPIFTPK